MSQNVLSFAMLLLVAAVLNQLATGAAVSSSNCCADLPQIFSDLDARLQSLSERLEKLEASGGGGGAGNCPLGYTHLKSVGKCYRLSTDQKTWEQGMASCATTGGDLVKIASQQENDAVVSYLATFGQTLTSYCNSIWIGAQRQDPNSCSTPFLWKTSEGTTSALRYSHWNGGEPNCAGGAEKCGSIIGDTHYGGQWNDLDCGRQMCSLCQADKA